jgi:hypothetical protein
MCARGRRAIHYITKPTESNSMQPNTTQIEKLKLTNRTTDDIFLIFNFPYFPSNQTNYIYQELASKSPNISHQIEKSGE